MDNNNKEKFHENYIEGRNAVLEAFRSGKTIDKLFVLDGCQDGPIKSITREARKHDAIINYVAKERLDQMSETGKHQGVIAVSAAYEYAEVSDILEMPKERASRLLSSYLRYRRSTQSWRNNTYRKSGGCTWHHHTKKACSGTYPYSGKDVCRCDKLYTCCQGYQYLKYHKRA